MRLGEVRFFDDDGDVLADALSAASNPGGNNPSSPTRSASKTIDGVNSDCWQDSMKVPATLQLTFASATSFAAYDLRGGQGGHCDRGGETASTHFDPFRAQCQLLNRPGRQHTSVCSKGGHPLRTLRGGSKGGPGIKLAASKPSEPWGLYNAPFRFLP